MDYDRIDALERLQRLRETGALSQEEFEAEKLALLTGAGLATRAHLIAACIAVVIVIASVAAWLLLNKRSDTQTEQPTIAAKPKLAPVAEPLPPADALAAAFQVATGHKREFTLQFEDQAATASPLKLIDAPFGPVLLTATEIKDGCHACAGAIGVYYLERTADGYRLKGKWPDEIRGWGWGALPSEWSVATKFTSFPAIYAEGGYTGQGITCGGATITELRPDGPVSSDMINLSYSNGGAVLDNGTTYGGEEAKSLDGKIANIVQDKGFDVIVSGAGIRERYARKGNKFVRVSGETRLSC